MPLGLSRLPLLAAVLSLVLSATGASAAPATGTATGQAAILNPLGLLKRSDLDFGKLVVSGAGTAAVNPVNGSMTTSATLLPVGSTAHPARFTATGSRNSIVHIRLPQNPITVKRVGGTETMTVSNWTLDGATNRKIPPNDTVDFSVGATLAVGAGQVAGTYVGTFNVTVQYP